MPSDADPSVSFPRTVPMYSHEKPDDLPVTLGMAQESGSTLRGCPLNVPHGKESRWPQDLTKHTRLMKWVFLFSRFSDALALPSVLLAKRAHYSRFIPSQNNNCPDFLPEPLDRFHHHFFASIIFLISANPFPLDFEISHFYRSKSASRTSVTLWTQHPLINPWRNKTLRVTEWMFLLWLHPLPVLHCLHGHNALVRLQTTAKLSPNIALLPYVPLSPRLIFVHQYLVLSHVRTVTSIPSAVQTRHTLHPFLTITTHACGMTIQDCTLIQISNVSLFFTSKHAARMPTGTDDDDPSNVEPRTLFGTVD